MTLQFPCDPEEATSEAVYKRMIDRIDALAVTAMQPTRGSRAGPFGRRGLLRRLGVEPQAVLRSGLFDAEYYGSTYKDVAATNADPLGHYLRYGDAEGRCPNAFFDPVFYRGQFAEAGKWPFSALYHYATVGEAAGLRPCAAFDRNRYLDGNPQLGSWLERPLAHFLWVGRHHGLSITRRKRLPAGQQVVVEMRRRPSPISPEGLRRAVNVIGPLDRAAGLGVSARGYLEGAVLSGFGPVGTRVQRREFGLQSPIAASTKFPEFVKDAAINLVHLNGDALPIMLRGGGRSILSDRYNIAIWYWELPTLRPEWQALMDEFHAFWAPTPFIAQAIRQSTSKPVHCIPPYLSYLSTIQPRRRVTSDSPHFVYCFDANSIVERKNPGLLLAAFLEAFPAGANARLTLKLTYPNRQLPEIERLYAVAKRNANVTIIDQLISDRKLHRLIASATAYVSPHRSEGLGLTVLEAMAFGTPVIGTPFGGAEPFITPDAAWPIAYRLAELADDYGPYPQGFVWADPDLGSLVTALRTVAADPNITHARAALARDRVLTRFASPAVTQACRDALESAAAIIGL